MLASRKKSNAAYAVLSVTSNSAGNRNAEEIFKTTTEASSSQVGNSVCATLPFGLNAIHGAKKIARYTNAKHTLSKILELSSNSCSHVVFVVNFNVPSLVYSHLHSKL